MVRKAQQTQQNTLLEVPPALPLGLLMAVWPPRKAGMQRGGVGPQWRHMYALTDAQQRCATRPVTHQDIQHMQRCGRLEAGVSV